MWGTIGSSFSGRPCSITVLYETYWYLVGREDAGEVYRLGISGSRLADPGRAEATTARAVVVGLCLNGGTLDQGKTGNSGNEDGNDGETHAENWVGLG